MFSVGRVIADPGVTTLLSPGLVTWLMLILVLVLLYLMVVNAKPAEEIHGDSLKKKNAFSACDVSQRSFPCPGGGKAPARPRSAVARGGPPAALGKRSVFP